MRINCKLSLVIKAAVALNLYMITLFSGHLLRIEKLLPTRVMVNDEC